MFDTLPPIHRYIPLIIGQTFSRQTLERVPEPEPITDQPENVLQYDQVMSTKLAIAYAVSLEIIYRARSEPFGGSAIDLACGPGHFSLCLAKHLKLDSLVGVDLSEPMIQTAKANAEKQHLPQCTFQLEDVTQLESIESNEFDLCTFADAAHHMPDLGTVGKVFAELDRITRPEGLVFVMDLVRLNTKELTDSYVNLLGHDYHRRGLSAFCADFHNSMHAAWTPTDLTSAIPVRSRRNWFRGIPIGIPSLQVFLGTPSAQPQRQLRKGLPWSPEHSPLDSSMRGEWHLVRRSLYWSKVATGLR
jgi:ubiquinone/menaquinone biosynthesis C-methylase UbiE